MKIAAVVNPTSGRGGAVKGWPALVKVAGLADRIDTLWTAYPGHAADLAAESRQKGYDRIIAVGGDGTLFEVVNGLWRDGREGMPSIGMVPFGTGCDYIRNFEVGAGRLERLIMAAGESTIRVSAGSCRFRNEGGQWSEKVFLMVLGAGFDANVIRSFRSRGMIRNGWPAYALSALGELVRWKPFRLTGEIDGKAFHSCSPVFLAALGRYFGKGIAIAPHAGPVCDKFELIRVESITRHVLPYLVFLSLFGAHLKHPRIHLARGSRVLLDSNPPAWIEADGELLGKTPLEIEIVPGALRFAAKKTRAGINPARVSASPFSSR